MSAPFSFGRIDISGSQNVLPGPAAPAFPGNLLEMQILRTHPTQAWLIQTPWE